MTSGAPLMSSGWTLTCDAWMEFTACEGPTVNYRHEALDPDRMQIRLLRILRDTTTQRLYGSVEVFDLEAAPEYHALSYAWGETPPTRQIPLKIGRSGSQRLQDVPNVYAPLPITANLAAFLELYRMRHEREYVWIDQICVNQENLQEKRRQVENMGKIFSNASMVIAWLGADKYDGAMLQWIDRYVSSAIVGGGKSAAALQAALQAKGVPAIDVAAVRSFLNNDYFKRLWIAQELILASEKVVWHGDRELPGKTMSGFFHIRRMLREPNILGPTDEVLPIPGMEYNDKANFRCIDSLFRSTDKAFRTLPAALVQHFGPHQCRDPRDKIYGLQGLLAPKYRIEVSYEKTPAAVYADFVKVLARLARGKLERPRPCLGAAAFLGRMMGLERRVYVKISKEEFPKELIKTGLKGALDYASSRVTIFRFRFGHNSWRN